MSVYRDTDQSPVQFKHPIGTALTATVTDSTGTVLDTATGLSPVLGVYTYAVPWKLTQYDGKYTLTWTDNNGFSRKQSFSVVTPLVSNTQLMTVAGNQAFSGDLNELEATIRAIIETYTGQSFGYSYGSQNYTGTGNGKLILKQRITRLVGILGVYGGFPSDYVQTTDPVTGLPTNVTNVYGELNTGRAGVIEDGWSILMNWPEYLDVRQSPPLELLDSAPSQDGTIRIPRRIMRERDKGQPYQITAEWGYDAVPEEVQEAALLLANDYLTGDSGYRDRYLEILKIQQDSFTYHPGAFRGTGNARVDLLLGPFRRQNGMVIL